MCRPLAPAHRPPPQAPTSCSAWKRRTRRCLGWCAPWSRLTPARSRSPSASEAAGEGQQGGRGKGGGGRREQSSSCTHGCVACACCWVLLTRRHTLPCTRSALPHLYLCAAGLRAGLRVVLKAFKLALLAAVLEEQRGDHSHKLWRREGRRGLECEGSACQGDTTRAQGGHVLARSLPSAFPPLRPHL